MTDIKTERDYYRAIIELLQRQFKTLLEVQRETLTAFKGEKAERVRLEERIEALVAELQRDVTTVSTDFICPACRKPYRHWDGKAYRCLQCD